MQLPSPTIGTQSGIVNTNGPGGGFPRLSKISAKFTKLNTISASCDVIFANCSIGKNNANINTIMATSAVAISGGCGRTGLWLYSEAGENCRLSK